MSGQATRPYRSTLSGSIGAGMGSVFSPNSRKYFILEHKVSSKYHRAGEAQEIIVNQIELGRDSRCQVRFDDSFSTVSRHHAAIVKDGDNWKLIQISKTNTTLLNGHPVKTEWYLQNGDEIQLSVNGPKLGFIIPSGKKATVGSIGLTRRLSLFRQQALRPYKQAIAVLAAVLVIAVGAGGTVIWKQNETIKDNSKLLAKANEENAKNADLIAQQKKILDNQSGLLDSLKKRKNKTIVKYVNKRNVDPKPVPTPDIDMSPCYPFVYYVTMYAKLPNGKEFAMGSGTGFQLSDGRFITARHVGRAPFFPSTFVVDKGKIAFVSNDPEEIYNDMFLNVLYQMGKLQLVFKCVSIGDSFTFTDSQIKDNGNRDLVATLEESFPLVRRNQQGKYEPVLGDDGKPIAIPAGTNLRQGSLGDNDWVYVNRGGGKGLKANVAASSSLKQGTQLYILGYPEGWAEGKEPILSTAMCSQNGLSSDLGNTIMASNGNTTGGNSGGPVFIRNGNEWEAVAIVSGSTGQRSYSKKGRFVPLSAVH